MEEDANKRRFWRSNWLWILFILFWLLVFPYILNKLILSESYWNVVGGPKEWLAFWPSYLSSIASAVMIAYTAMTLKNNKSQLDELKRQWDEEHKPNLTVSYNMIEGVAYLRLVNTSKSEICNLKINGDFYIGTEKSNYFNMSILEQFNINIESQGVRNIILLRNSPSISNDCYFILNLSYNNIEKKGVKVYCNDVYSIGDDIIWGKLIEGINKIRK